MAERHDVQVRWPDIDGLGHVNHSAILVYLEVGRDASLAARGILGDQYVIRHCDVNYQSQVKPVGPHVIYEWESAQLGRTSIRTTERLLDSDGKCAVEATFTLVMWDPKERTSRPLTLEERKKLSNLEQEH